MNNFEYYVVFTYFRKSDEKYIYSSCVLNWKVLTYVENINSLIEAIKTKLGVENIVIINWKLLNPANESNNFYEGSIE